MNKNLALESLLYHLFLVLGLAFVSLIFASLALADADHRDTSQSIGTSADSQQDKSRTQLKKGYDREEVLRVLRARLTEKIRKELVTLPNYNVFDNLAFSLDSDDVVTLYGQVRLPSLKVDAERAVDRIEGVNRVVNQLEVLPTSFFDDDIRRVAFRRIYSQSQLSRYAIQPVPPIHIIVSNGRLTLEGIVATESDKVIAGIRANQIPNVFQVVNNLRVENPEHSRK